tara:strand:+ start:4035 stop:4328 length:294 start_codon:yes stop_codon:yes gene_type:complete
MKKYRTELLKKANNLITGNRAKDYGDARENHQRIANIWSVILGYDIKPEQVVACMIGVKLARLANTMKKEDTWVDIIGYGALGGEFVKKKKRKKQSK